MRAWQKRDEGNPVLYKVNCLFALASRSNGQIKLSKKQQKVSVCVCVYLFHRYVQENTLCIPEGKETAPIPSTRCQRPNRAQTGPKAHVSDFFALIAALTYRGSGLTCSRAAVEVHTQRRTLTSHSVKSNKPTAVVKSLATRSQIVWKGTENTQGFIFCWDCDFTKLEKVEHTPVPPLQNWIGRVKKDRFTAPHNYQPSLRQACAKPSPSPASRL